MPIGSCLLGFDQAFEGPFELWSLVPAFFMLMLFRVLTSVDFEQEMSIIIVSQFCDSKKTYNWNWVLVIEFGFLHATYFCRRSSNFVLFTEIIVSSFPKKYLLEVVENQRVS